jgi:hypothetical protein
VGGSEADATNKAMRPFGRNVCACTILAPRSCFFGDKSLALRDTSTLRIASEITTIICPLPSANHLDVRYQVIRVPYVQSPSVVLYNRIVPSFARYNTHPPIGMSHAVVVYTSPRTLSLRRFVIAALKTASPHNPQDAVLPHRQLLIHTLIPSRFELTEI